MIKQRLNKSKLLGVVITLIIPTLFSFSTSANNFNTIIQTQTQKVYICSGNYATKFHSVSNCRGLNNCKGTIYYLESQTEAIKKGYSHCLICWK